MSTAVSERKAATEKQLAYIERLSVELGRSVPEFGDGISSFEASQLISELIGKSSEKVVKGASGRHVINEARLGMAMKECFKLMKKRGYDICDHSRDREAFISEVIDTYWLFTEISEKILEST